MISLQIRWPPTPIVRSVGDSRRGGQVGDVDALDRKWRGGASEDDGEAGSVATPTPLIGSGGGGESEDDEETGSVATPTPLIGSGGGGKSEDDEEASSVAMLTPLIESGGEGGGGGGGSPKGWWLKATPKSPLAAAILDLPLLVARQASPPLAGLPRRQASTSASVGVGG